MTGLLEDAVPHQADVTPSVAAPQPRRRDGQRSWLLATAGLTLLAGLLAVALNRRFYFYDDTQIGAFGTWYELGDSLRSGRWPILDPSRWMGGNVAAEGQWGVWNPVVLAIGVLASLAADALVFSTIVKLALLVLAAVGTHVLVHDRGVPGPLCAVAGVAVPLGGFTVYMDSPSWVTGLMTWAALPWAWRALVRLAEGRSGIVWPFVMSFLIVTVGYVHGTLMLAVAYLGVIVGALVARRPRRDVLAVIGCGALITLVTVTVYLPSVLTAHVTVRNERGIFNTDFLSADLGGLLSSVSSEGLAALPGWWGSYAPAPMVYVAWFLPVLAFVDWRAARTVFRRHVDVLVVLGVAVLMVLGPSDIGPLRFPVRLMPYVALGAIVLVVILLAHAPARPITTGRLLAALAWVGVAGFISWSGRPPTWEAIVAGTVLTAAAIVGTRWVLNARPGPDWRRAGLVMIGCTLALSTVQRVVHDSSPLPDFGLPTDVASYRQVPPTAVGDVVVVGSPTMFGGDPRMWDEAVVGNIWYASEASVQNVYTPVSFARYADVMCMNWRGETCPDLVNRLFAVQPATGLPLVDQLSADTIVMFNDEIGAATTSPPDGWSLADESDYTTTWVRDTPAGPAGGLAWASAGLRLAELGRTDTSVRLRVEEVGPEGGRAVLSRLAWPGYAVDGATLGEPTDGYLLTIDVGPDAAGRTIDVTFRPPGWRIEVVALIAALVGFIAWAVVERFTARRSRPAAEVPTAPG